MTVPTFTLADGTTIPAAAFGTANLPLLSRDPTTATIDPEMLDKIKRAIRNGWRHFDSAERYTTEPELGQAIAESGIPRAGFYITSKVHPDFGHLGNVEQAVRKSLADLRTDYIDLYLIHNPFITKEKHGVSIEEVWSQLEDIHTKGLVRSIGISNFRPKDIQRVLDVARVKPVVNQIELHPYCFEHDTVDLGKKHNITTASFGPLIPVVRHKDGPVFPLATTLAKKYRVTPAQILLRWQIQLGFVVVTATGDDTRQKEQLDLDSFELTPEEVSAITKEGSKHPVRVFGWGEQRRTYDDPKNDPFPEGFRL